MQTYSNKSWFRLRAKRIILIALFILIFIGTVFVPLPYFVEGPGSAESVRARVSVPSSTASERGEFLFTTVSRISKPSLLALGYSKLTERHSEILPERKVLGTISNLDAYDQLVKWMRIDSESSAIIAAYQYLKKPLEVEKQGLIIRMFLENAPAAKVLHEGDIIVEADSKPVKALPDLAQILAGRSPGDSVSIKIQRGSQQLELKVPLMELKDSNGTKRTGIGFIAAQVQEAHPAEDISFKLEDIGGPSAGLMLSLELLSKLENKDYTKGHHIAGTGTIDAEGNVGQIGGIRYKLVAADREKAEYFFVPKDPSSDNSNDKDAEEFLRTYHTNMKLVPVSTLKEAADFLMQLPEKP